MDIYAAILIKKQLPVLQGNWETMQRGEKERHENGWRKEGKGRLN